MRAALTLLGFAAVIVGAIVALALHDARISSGGAWLFCAAGLGAIVAGAWRPDNGIVIRRRGP